MIHLYRVNGKSRCSYNHKVSCDTDKSDEPQRKVEEKEFVNKTLDEICGKNFIGDSEPQPRSLRGREGRIINGTKARYGRWPWQVSLRQWNKFKGDSQ